MAAAPALSAQRYWRDNLYPYVFYSTVDGLGAAFHYGRTSPLSFVERPFVVYTPRPGRAGQGIVRGRADPPGHRGAPARAARTRPGA